MMCEYGTRMRDYGYTRVPKKGITEYNWVCPKCGKTKTIRKEIVHEN